MGGSLALVTVDCGIVGLDRPPSQWAGCGRQVSVAPKAALTFGGSGMGGQ